MSDAADLRSLDEALRDTMHAERTDALRGPDGPEGRALAAVVAAAVAHHRARRGLSRAALAQATGIRDDLLGLLEAGQAVPSLRAIWTLATALAVPFGALLGRPEPRDPGFRVLPAGRGQVIAAASDRFRSRALTPAGHPRAPEVYELTLAPGCREIAAPHAPDTYEHLTVVRGTLVVQAGDDRATLGPGDALFFRADRPHGYENPTDTDTVALLVMAYA